MCDAPTLSPLRRGSEVEHADPVGARLDWPSGRGAAWPSGLASCLVEILMVAEHHSFVVADIICSCAVEQISSRFNVSTAPVAFDAAARC